jgi:ribonuclease HI
MYDEIFLFTDGAARQNPGPAAAGFRILTPGADLLEVSAEPIGQKTNNEAEYIALIRGLRSCRAHTRRRVRVGSDSQLLVQQMQRVWRVREPRLEALQREAMAEAASFEEVSYRYYPRSHPEIARVDRSLKDLLDELGNQ